MRKVSLENGQNVLRFDCGADDFYFSCGMNLYAADALQEVLSGNGGGMLWLWGGSGCGKSHLLRGLFRDYKSLCSPSAAIMSAGTICDELMAAMCTGTMAELADRYSSLRLLVVEDMEFLSGRETMENIFKQLFESVAETGCSIVLSSASHPENYPEIYVLLMGCGGMCVELEYPDTGCRKNYAVATCVEWGVYITLEEAEALAESCASVPQLRGPYSPGHLKRHELK